MLIAIVDDEKEDNEQLARQISEWAENEHLSINCRQFYSGDEFIASLTQINYNIMFMDIYMSGMNGIETATQMRKTDMNCVLIFLTYSTDHMPEAFPCHAFDYIVKPLKTERLYKTLSEAVMILPDKLPYINLTLGKRTIPVLFDDIYYVTSDSNYCIVCTSNEDYRCRISFSEVMDTLLEDSRFCTINRGVIINFDYVNEMKDLCCIMKNEKRFPINTRKSKQFEQALVMHRFKNRRKYLKRRFDNDNN